MARPLRLSIIFVSCLVIFSRGELFAQNAKSPIIVNGDTVEYSTDNKEVSATGNVSVIYEGAKLTCRKLTVNTETKDALAEGDVRLDDKQGVINAEKVVYSFQNKTGMIINANFMSNPYFGKAQKLEKVNEQEFVIRYGHVTTCSFDHPHYRLQTKKTSFFPGDKIQTKDDIFYAGNVPMLYIPQYNHTLTDEMMHQEIVPGYKKDWGAYLLTAWRYNLTENVNGRVYLDYRSRLGWAEGFGTNYKSPEYGKGSLKVYYTEEKPEKLSGTSGDTQFRRYMVRWRHKWDIDPATSFTTEFFKIGDERRQKQDPNADFLKDYFFREFEKDSKPLTYALFHHSFANSSFNLLAQKRINHWYTQQNEKLPEASYSLPSYQLGDSPFYFDNNTSLGSYNRKDTSVNPVGDIDVSRFDIVNKFSLPMRLAIINFTPFVKNEETFYDRGENGDSLPIRSIFYTGADLSTKFYRVFDMKTNFLGLNVNGLRHIITPTVSYNYNHQPTIGKQDLRQFDSIDALTHNEAIIMELTNKLQTKRNGQTVDLANVRVNTVYNLNAKADELRQDGFADFITKIELVPYAWMRFYADVTYNKPEDHLTQANYDLNFTFDKDRTIGFGQRYLRGGGNELTMGFNWRLNPKWRFSVYERYQTTASVDTSKGMREQQYTLTRDLHCWLMDITYDIDRYSGHTIYLVFRMKAFPEMQIGLDQSYNSPKSSGAGK